LHRRCVTIRCRLHSEHPLQDQLLRVGAVLVEDDAGGELWTLTVVEPEPSPAAFDAIRCGALPALRHQGGEALGGIL